jgi:biopolymer transport protein ExbD
MANKLMELNRRATFGLQLTAMVDMFTILLVFLLKSFSSSSVQINPADGLRLPQSQSYAEATEALLVTVSAKGIYVDEQRIVEFKNGQIESNDLDKGDDRFIRPLYEELNRNAERTRDIASKNETLEFAGKVILQADRSLPYDLLRKVMYTSSIAGYADMKLATISSE